jgi:hypothetical protein
MQELRAEVLLPGSVATSISGAAVDKYQTHVRAAEFVVEAAQEACRRHALLLARRILYWHSFLHTACAASQAVLKT